MNFTCLFYNWNYNEFDYSWIGLYHIFKAP